MVGDDAMRGLLRPVGIDPGQLGDDADQRLEQIDGVIVVRALQNRRDARGSPNLFFLFVLRMHAHPPCRTFLPDASDSLDNGLGD